MNDTPLGAFIGWPAHRLACVVEGLAQAALTVACAESLTGGLLSAVLTEVPGASAVFRGGLIVYATDLKHSLAGVDAELLAARGPVDPDVALALADGARRACGASVGIGLTGVAGPDRQNGVAVGTWFVAVAGPDGSQLRSNGGTKGQSGRAEVRAEAACAALELLEGLTTSGQSIRRR